MYRICAILLLFLSSVYSIDGKEPSHQWQDEIANTSYQDDYKAAFALNENSLIVDAKKCQPFDSRCVWQRVRVWIGIALDELDARKENAENDTRGTGLHCTVTYSVYQVDPEEVLLQCQNGITEKIHYTQLERFLKKKFL